MAITDKSMQSDLIAATQRILKLGGSDLRVTDSGLVCKNPNYSLCDVMLKTDTVYCIEYLLSYWASKTGHVPCFVFKNTGCAVSLCCYVQAPGKLASCSHVQEFNCLRVNETLVVNLSDIDRIKPSKHGVLTNCVIRKSTYGNGYNIDLVAFGPENEAEYEDLLRELYLKKCLRSPSSSYGANGVGPFSRGAMSGADDGGASAGNADDRCRLPNGVLLYEGWDPEVTPPPPPPPRLCNCCPPPSVRRAIAEREAAAAKAAALKEAALRSPSRRRRGNKRFCAEASRSSGGAGGDDGGGGGEGRGDGASAARSGRSLSLRCRPFLQNLTLTHVVLFLVCGALALLALIASLRHVLFV